MKKIISLFKRDYEGTRLVYDEVTPGAEWVIEGEGIATEKIDGTACMVRGGKLCKRYDRKLQGDSYKPAPPEWEAAEENPDPNTGHWPGWLPVGDSPDDRWHKEALANTPGIADGTYELIGPKVQRNLYQQEKHYLIGHGAFHLDDVPRTFQGLRYYFEGHVDIEGVVWHHPDGRMVKIKRRDFGLPWPS